MNEEVRTETRIEAHRRLDVILDIIEEYGGPRDIFMSALAKDGSGIHAVNQARVCNAPILASVLRACAAVLEEGKELTDLFLPLPSVH